MAAYIGLYTSLYLRLAVFFWSATFGIVPADFPNTCGEVVFNCQGSTPRQPTSKRSGPGGLDNGEPHPRRTSCPQDKYTI